MKISIVPIKKTLAIISLVFAIFISLALLSYSPNDPSMLQILNHDSDNITGDYGSYIADPIIQSLGLSSCLFIVFIIITSIKVLSNLESKLLLLRVSILPLATLSLAVFLASLNANEENILHYDTWNIGGFVGYYLESEFAIEFGIKRVMIASSLTSLITIIFCLGISISEYKSLLFKPIHAIINTMHSLQSRVQKSQERLKSSFNTPVKQMETNQNLKYKVKEEDHLNNIFNDIKNEDVNNNRFAINDNIDSSNKDKLTNILNSSFNNPKNIPDNLGHHSFILPDTQILSKAPLNSLKNNLTPEYLNDTAELLIQVLQDFGIRGDVVGIHPGPVVTLYEIEPAAGTKSSRVIGLADDIARSMSAISARIAVIPGKNAIGIELPNSYREIVYLRELLESDTYQQATYQLPLILGKNISGNAVIADLAKMPHLLVAGTTGSGKSVAVNTMILSLLYKHTPKECKLMLIDPKMLELSVYDGIPHLLSPVVTNPKKAIAALKWVVKEMESRYRAMSILGVRNINGYNQLVSKSIEGNNPIEKQVQVGFDAASGKPIFEIINIKEELLPYIVVVVDEMADLMLVAGKDIEAYIQRLAQMARAAGIHLIMATQRPSVDVITGVIKANFPTRISFQVTSKIDSRTILGEQGAEQLLGMGDMLYMIPGGKIERVHGPFVTDKEVEDVVSFLKEQGPPQYIDDITSDINDDEPANSEIYANTDDDNDELYQQALAIVIKERRATTSYLQRCLKVGYNRAALMIEKMEKDGVVSSPNHVGRREVLVNDE